MNEIFVYLFWERASVNRGGSEREGERESEAGSIGCHHQAWCGAQSHKLQDHDLS